MIFILAYVNVGHVCHCYHHCQVDVDLMPRPNMRATRRGGGGYTLTNTATPSSQTSQNHFKKGAKGQGQGRMVVERSDEALIIRGERVVGEVKRSKQPSLPSAASTTAGAGAGKRAGIAVGIGAGRTGHLEGGQQHPLARKWQRHQTKQRAPGTRQAETEEGIETEGEEEIESDHDEARAGAEETENGRKRELKKSPITAVVNTAEGKRALRVDITEPKHCSSRDRIRQGDDLEMHYVGTIDASSSTGEKGQKFDSSYDRNSPFRFRIGQGRVIKGWDQVVSHSVTFTNPIYTN